MPELPRDPVYDVADPKMRFRVFKPGLKPGIVELETLAKPRLASEAVLSNRIAYLEAVADADERTFSDLKAADAAEASARAAADAAEVQARQNAIASAVAAEATARQNADATEKSERQAADAAEASARASADTQERTERIAADAAEATARQNADAAEASARAAADTQEKTERQAADTSEANARIAADNAEAQARATADSTEASTRSAADTALGNRIAALEALTPRRAIVTYAGADYTWTYPTAFPAGTVPIIEVLVEGGSTATALYNAQLVGAPTNTSAKIRINTIPAASVSLLGLANLNLFQQAPSGVRLHLAAFAP